MISVHDRCKIFKVRVYDMSEFHNRTRITLGISIAAAVVWDIILYSPGHEFNSIILDGAKNDTNFLSLREWWYFIKWHEISRISDNRRQLSRILMTTREKRLHDENTIVTVRLYNLYAKIKPTVKRCSKEGMLN